MQQEERIAELIASQIRGSLSPEDLEELNKWKAESSQNSEFAEQFTMDYLKNELEALSKIDAETGWLLLNQKLERSGRTPTPVVDIDKPPRSRSSTWRRVMIAASVAAVIIAGTYISRNLNRLTKKEQPGVATTKQPDIPPVGNKALLTLSDGRKINLNESHNGLLAEDGGSVINAQKGRLIYENHGEKAELAYNTVSTMHGGTYQLTLPDQTKVWLNAGSSIRFPTAFTGRTRPVEISGEIYFEVAKDPRKPFLVQAKDLQVNVLGTHFNVNEYAQNGLIATTLLEGAVQLTQGSSRVLLKPGQQGIIDSKKQLKVLSSIDLEQVMGWQQGRFVFKDASITSIMDQVGRYYDVEIVYRDQISSSFDAIIESNVPVSKLLHLLELTGLVQFRIEDRRIIVMR